ncbi:hypothetical protein [Gracilimonas sp.]|uniref:hypothetical protein n=1 Tax=Gracilimonas sp. TaxID=1974203 RepID=UPI0032EC85B9
MPLSSVFAQTQGGSGSIYFSFNVDTAFVQFGINKTTIQKVANNDTLVVKNGFYHLHLSYPTNEDVYLTLNVLKDSLYEVSHEFDLNKNSIDLNSKNASIRYLIGGDLVALSDSNTKIKLEDSTIGEEFAIIDLEKNSAQKLSFQNPEYFSKHFQVSQDESVIFKEHYFHSENQSVTFLEFIPSISQFKRKEYVKTGLILGSLIASTSFFLKFQNKFSDKKAEYLSIRKQYLNADTESQALLLGDLMTEKAEKLKPHNLRRNLSLLGVLAVLGFDVYDKIRYKQKVSPPDQKKFELLLEPNFEQYISIGATLKL